MKWVMVSVIVVGVIIVLEGLLTSWRGERLSGRIESYEVLYRRDEIHDFVEWHLYVWGVAGGIITTGWVISFFCERNAEWIPNVIACGTSLFIIPVLLVFQFVHPFEELGVSRDESVVLSQLSLFPLPTRVKEVPIDLVVSVSYLPPGGSGVALVDDRGETLLTFAEYVTPIISEKELHHIAQHLGVPLEMDARIK